MSQILAWTDATVAPEGGQTTVIEVWNADCTVLLATHDGITGTSFDVPNSSFGDEAVVFLQIWAERTDDDGTFRSLQAHGIWVQVAEGDFKSEQLNDVLAESGDTLVLEP